MRTTLTLEPDVDAAIRAARRHTGVPQKVVDGETLRRGLRDLSRESPQRTAYVTEPVDPGKPALVGVHSVYDMLAYAEGEDFR